MTQAIPAPKSAGNGRRRLPLNRLKLSPPIRGGTADKQNNVIKNAPHTAEAVIRDKWDHLYSRELAVFPAKWTRDNKFWPAVGRLDNVYGNRNLICSRVGMENYS